MKSFATVARKFKVRVCGQTPMCEGRSREQTQELVGELIQSKQEDQILLHGLYKGKEKTEEGAGRGSRIKRGFFFKKYEINYSIFVSLMEKISRGGRSQ